MTDRDLLVKEFQGAKLAIDINAAKRVEIFSKVRGLGVAVALPELDALENEMTELHRRRDKILKAIEGLPENVLS
jgi:hypothetical protein